MVCVCVLCDALYRPGPSACAGLMEFAQPLIGKRRNHIMSLKDFGEKREAIMLNIRFT